MNFKPTGILSVLIAGTVNHVGDVTKSHAVQKFTFDAVETGEELLAFAAANKYDLIVLTNELPDQDGLRVLKQLRADNDKTPVIALIAGKDDHEIRVAYLWAGADHVLQMPYHVDKFVARAKAVVHRAAGEFVDVIRRGNLVVNLSEKTVFVKGRQVPLTNQEYLIVEYLALRKFAPKESLHNYIYNPGEAKAKIKIIDILTGTLRKKLAVVSGDGQNFIETVWGLGYKLSESKTETMHQPQVETTGTSLALTNVLAAKPAPGNNPQKLIIST